MSRNSRPGQDCHGFAPYASILLGSTDPDAAKELRTLFLRVDSTIRAWYKNLFEEMLVSGHQRSVVNGRVPGVSMTKAGGLVSGSTCTAPLTP